MGRKLKKLFVCKKCGMTHYKYIIPKKCTNCNKKFNKIEKNKLEVFQI